MWANTVYILIILLSFTLAFGHVEQLDEQDEDIHHIPIHNLTYAGTTANPPTSFVMELPKNGETWKYCGGDKEKVYLIYKTKPNFHPQITVCFDTQLYTTHWVHHQFQRRRKNAQDDTDAGMKDSTISETEWTQWGLSEDGIQTNLFPEHHAPRDVDDYYFRHMGAFSKLLGCAKVKKIKETTRDYITRGHLAAKGDFRFSDQKMTLNFINAAPQWRGSNAGNWNKLENFIRTNPLNRPFLDIYTGTLGQLSLPRHERKDKTPEEVPLWLALGKSKTVPVPRFLWKCYEVESEDGIKWYNLVVISNTPFKESNVWSKGCNRECDVGAFGFYKKKVQDGKQGVNEKENEPENEGKMYCCGKVRNCLEQVNRMR